MVLPHPLLVLQPPRLGWGRTRCRAGVCGNTAQMEPLLSLSRGRPSLEL